MNQSSPTDTFPTPQDRPGVDVMVFDGQCGICRSQMEKLQWWDCQQHLSYLSLHDPQVTERWPELSHERMMQEMVIVDRTGKKHWGPEAVRYLTWRLRRLWWAMPVLYFPGSMLIWRPLYAWVARNRYRLSGGVQCEDGTCHLHQHGKEGTGK